MKKVISTLSVMLITASAFAIDPSGFRIDYGDNGVNIPSPYRCHFDTWLYDLK